ncbi:gamma-glutamyltransferase [Mesorhizobium sp. KR9-304]|uniref:gamma-glutamyltransferase n=1 Tax=Mesorhizobium sp. KR9-304 TaxID=3156614 RepID=UPI0032B5EA8F
MRAVRPIIALALLLAAQANAAFAQQAADTVAPESRSAVSAKQAVHASRQMVVAANPIAAQAGLDALRAGGSAADAVVAVQTVLGLVEPQSSGLGGGAFLTWYDAKSGTVTTFDGRETAPAAATPALFLGADGKPLGFFDAVVGGRSVGVPGVPRLLETVHAKYGRLGWAELMDPAIKLAEGGFAVSPRLHAMITQDVGRLDTQPATRAYFFDALGAPVTAGAVVRNPDYAASLRTIAEGGADAFYRGPIADKIVAAVQSHPTNPGSLSLDDLANYQVKERPAACAPYRGLSVCGMGPPSSGALTIGQILGMVEPFDIATLGPEDPESWRIVGDATRLAFADRERYIADSDFVNIPKGLLNADYLKARSALIRRPTALPDDAVAAGEPSWDKAELGGAEPRIDGVAFDMPATTHFTIVDADGNVAAMTSSVENAFGSRQMAGGFILNNQLTDFSFAPEKDGAAVANRVEPGKRPRSSMAPTIVLKDGKPFYALGSPGGSSIIPYVATTLIALIDWKLDMQAAISMPHMLNRFGTFELEAGTTAENLAGDLEALGYKIKIGDQNSGLHGVAIMPDGLTGGADPRREGIALGD